MSGWIKHRSLRKLINLELYPIYWRTHSEMRRKMRYFVVFQPSKVEMPIFSASILINLTHFPRWLRKSAIKIKKNSENLSRVGASIRAKMHRLGMGGQESNRQSLKSQEDKALFHQVKSHVLLRDRVRKAKSSNGTRYIFIPSLDIRHSPCPEKLLRTWNDILIKKN